MDLIMAPRISSLAWNTKLDPKSKLENDYQLLPNIVRELICNAKNGIAIPRIVLSIEQDFNVDEPAVAKKLRMMVTTILRIFLDENLIKEDLEVGYGEVRYYDKSTYYQWEYSLYHLTKERCSDKAEIERLIQSPNARLFEGPKYLCRPSKTSVASLSSSSSSSTCVFYKNDKFSMMTSDGSRAESCFVPTRSSIEFAPTAPRSRPLLRRTKGVQNLFVKDGDFKRVSERKTFGRSIRAYLSRMKNVISTSLISAGANVMQMKKRVAQDICNVKIPVTKFSRRAVDKLSSKMKIEGIVCGETKEFC